LSLAPIQEVLTSLLSMTDSPGLVRILMRLSNISIRFTRPTYSACSPDGLALESPQLALGKRLDECLIPALPVMVRKYHALGIAS
jgi:hypothetical protein